VLTVNDLLPYHDHCYGSNQIAIPAAPIHATPHFIAFFVPRVVVYASSQDFIETALGQPYLNTKETFNPRYTRYPAFQPIPITSGPIQIPPANPEELIRTAMRP
jgi:hypothetical protein